LVDDFVVPDVIERKKIELTEEGRGSQKTALLNIKTLMHLHLMLKLLRLIDVEAKVGDLDAKIWFAKATKNKWVRLESDKVSVTRI